MEKVQLRDCRTVTVVVEEENHHLGIGAELLIPSRVWKIVQ